MKISWQLLHDLDKTYGESFYLLDLERFRGNYDAFLDAFRSIYPNTNIAYSYKTNYTPRLCQLVNRMGGYAEVVSHMEYDLAIQVGVPPQRVIFNGPYKRKADIKQALLAGSIVNLDSFYEVAIVRSLAQSYPQEMMTVGIRCNFDIDAEPISRFGFDISTKEFESVLETLGNLDNCRVGGLHCHFLPPRRSTESYALIAKKMLELSATYFNENQLQFIDLGGGFFSKMGPDLQQQFGYAIPTYKQYAEAIASEFASVYPLNAGPELILEPGISITADIMRFVAKIIDIKKVRSRTVALASGSIYNIKPTLNNKHLPICVLSNYGPTRLGQPREKIDIVGYTCMENDCLYQGFGGALTVGDYVVFENVGAYTIVLKPPFILPCPAIIAYDSSIGEFEVVKRCENFSDIFSTYAF